MKTKVCMIILLVFNSITVAFSQIQVTPNKIYQGVVQKGYETQEVVAYLANYYYAKKEYTQASLYYTKLMKGIGYLPEPIDYYRYGKVLQLLGKNNEAKRQFNLFEGEAQKFFAKQPASPSNTAVKEMMGMVSNTETGNVIEGAEISLINLSGDNSLVDKSDINGFFIVPFTKINPTYQHAYIEIYKENYDISYLPIAFNAAHQKVISLQPQTFVVNQGDNLANIFGIDNIYFDFGRTNIRKDASVQLAKILIFLELHPNVNLTIKVHTDSRGEDDYNMNLTETQAKAIEQWLLKKGINKTRIQAKGYGETQLINGCEDGVPCSEEEHRINKRVEFIVNW